MTSRIYNLSLFFIGQNELLGEPVILNVLMVLMEMTCKVSIFSQKLHVVCSVFFHVQNSCRLWRSACRVHCCCEAGGARSSQFNTGVMTNTGESTFPSLIIDGTDPSSRPSSNYTLDWAALITVLLTLGLTPALSSFVWQNNSIIRTWVKWDDACDTVPVCTHVVNVILMRKPWAPLLVLSFDGMNLETNRRQSDSLCEFRCW